MGLVCFGFSPILVRFATDVQPMTLAALRTVFAVLILLPFWYPKRKTLRELKAGGVNVRLMMLSGFFLGLHLTLFIASLHYTSVASATILVTMHPAMMIVAESILFKKRFRSVIWIGVLLACLGSVLLGYADQTQVNAFENSTLGNTFAFMAAVIFVFYFLIGGKIRKNAEWIDYVFHVYLHAAIICLVLTFVWVGGWPYLSLTAVLIGLALAVGPTIIGHGSLNYAVKFISPTLLATFVLSEVVIAAIAAYYLFDELPTLLAMIAMAIIMAGVILSWTRKKPATPVSSADL